MCSAAIPGCRPSSRLKPGSRCRETAGPPSSPPDRLPTPTRWCRRPTPCEPKLAALSSSGVTVTLTGDSALWANFNTANRSAMLRSEMLSWPVTIIILVIAFGSLVAAGLPLLLTMAGLLVAAGALVITTKFTPVSIWALNFALMFALALGIDYALFLVMRFRSALKRRGAEPGDREAIVASVAETVDTAGKAVAFSALTVLASLAAILIVPSPAFRSMAFGIMLSVVAVLAATLTLLPAVLGKLGTNINKGKIRLRRGPRPEGEGPLDRILHRWGNFLWRHPFPAGAAALVLLLLAAAPIIGMRTNMPSITIVPASANARVGYDQVTSAFGPGAPGTLQVVVPQGEQARALATLAHTSGVAGVVPGPTNAGWTLDQVVPTTGPSTTATGATIDHLRQVLPAGTLIGGAAAENHDLQQSLASHTPLVLAILGVLGFLLAADRPRCPADRRARVCSSPPCRWPVPSASAGSSSRTATCPDCSASSPRASSTPGPRCSSEPWSSAWPWTTRCSCCRRPRSATRRTPIPSTPWSARCARRDGSCFRRPRS